MNWSQALAFTNDGDIHLQSTAKIVGLALLPHNWLNWYWGLGYMFHLLVIKAMLWRGHCSVNIFVGGHYGWWHMLLGVSSCGQMPAWHLLGAHSQYMIMTIKTLSEYNNFVYSEQKKCVVIII